MSHTTLHRRLESLEEKRSSIPQSMEAVDLATAVHLYEATVNCLDKENAAAREALHGKTVVQAAAEYDAVLRNEPLPHG